MAQKCCLVMSVFCIFQFPFEVFEVNCTPEVNGNFTVNLTGKSNMLVLLEFSPRTVGESV